MTLDLGPGCLVTVLSWGSDGVFLSVMAWGPSGTRACSVVREGPFSGSMWAWRRADAWEGVAPGSCPVRPYGPPVHLAAALRWLQSELGPLSLSWEALARAAVVLRQEGLREALEVMES